MAYNNGFPMNYNYQYPQQYQPPITLPQPQPQINQNQNQNNPIIWVQGIEGAKSYLVAPNNTVQLWDSEQQSIYLKSADASGMPSIKILDYTIRNAQNEGKKAPLEDNTVKYATKEEIAEIRAEFAKKIDDLKEGLGA